MLRDVIYIYRATPSARAYVKASFTFSSFYARGRDRERRDSGAKPALPALRARFAYARERKDSFARQLLFRIYERIDVLSLARVERPSSLCISEFYRNRITELELPHWQKFRDGRKSSRSDIFNSPAKSPGDYLRAQRGNPRFACDDLDIFSCGDSRARDRLSRVRKYVRMSTPVTAFRRRDGSRRGFLFRRALLISDEEMERRERVSADLDVVRAVSRATPERRGSSTKIGPFLTRRDLLAADRERPRIPRSRKAVARVASRLGGESRECSQRRH